MSDQPKLPGGKRAQDELTRLKYHWRDVLTPSQKDFWRARFNSTDSQAVIREEMRVKLKFDLKYDKQLTAFRKWDELQQTIDAEALQQSTEEAKLREEFGDLTDDQIRRLVIRGSYARAKARGDYKLGLATIREDRGLIETMTGRDKFEFNAAKACLAKLPELKAISSNRELSEDQKLEQARLALFGTAPK